MYYVLYRDYAIGPFLRREDAYSYMAAKEVAANEYAVKSDAVMQEKYQHITVVKPYSKSV